MSNQEINSFHGLDSPSGPWNIIMTQLIASGGTNITAATPSGKTVQISATPTMKTVTKN